MQFSKPLLVAILTFVTPHVTLALSKQVVQDGVDFEDNNDSLDYIADRIPIKDEMEIEDEELVMAHVEMDIRDFEDLERTIEILQNHIRKHSTENVVNQNNLNEASQALENLYLTDVHPALIDLKLVKKELVAVKHNLQNITLERINDIVERAEQFLSSAYSTVRLIQHEDQEWNLEEEERKIKESFHPDTNFSKPLIQKIYLNDSQGGSYPIQAAEGLKVSLENAKAVLQKIKEEKANRHKPKVENLEKSIPEEEKDSRPAEIETEELLRQLKIQLDEEAARRLVELHNSKQSKMPENDHVTISNKTLEAFEQAKNQAHEFLNKVLYDKDESNIKVRMCVEDHAKIKNST